MAENLLKKPKKSILKTSSSFEKPELPPKSRLKETKWDEMNIIATHHPPDKDYGHMKIEEPKTPFNYYDEEGERSGDEADGLDAEMLAKKIQLGSKVLPRAMAAAQEEEEEEEEEEDENLTEEEKAKKQVFESKRKSHYNEFYAVKLARKLMAKDKDEDDDDDDEEENNCPDVKQKKKDCNKNCPSTSTKSCD